MAATSSSSSTFAPGQPLVFTSAQHPGYYRAIPRQDHTGPEGETRPPATIAQGNDPTLQAVHTAMMEEGWVRLFDDTWRNRYTSAFPEVDRILRDMNRTVQQVGATAPSLAPSGGSQQQQQGGRKRSAEDEAVAQQQLQDREEFARLQLLEGPTIAGSRLGAAQPRAPRFLHGNFRRFFNMVATRLAGVPLGTTYQSTFQQAEPDETFIQTSSAAGGRKRSQQSTTGAPAKRRRRPSITTASRGSSSSSTTALAARTSSSPLPSALLAQQQQQEQADEDFSALLFGQ